jgi:hypothetical protein
MINLVDWIAAVERQTFAMFGGAATYVLNDAVTTASLKAYVRGLRSQDLFAAAAQQDVLGVVDAAAFVVAFPARVSPQRFDRLRVGTISYAVEQWRGSPDNDQPVFFKLLLRGGNQ